MAEETTKALVESSQEKLEQPTSPRERGPLEGLQREINRLFEAFPWGPWHIPFTRTTLDLEPFWRTESKLGAVPVIDVIERDDAYQVIADLPGMNADDIEVKCAKGALTIKGERKEEKEEKKKGYYVSERRYGAFQRTFRVPDGIDEDKIEARYKNGVLTVLLPKTAEAQKAEKTIPVQQG